MKTKTKDKAKTKEGPMSEKRAEELAGNGSVNEAQAGPALKYVLRKSMQPDPEQPRKEFDGEKLRELADSMMAVGIRQPVQVEWMAPLEVVEPDLVDRAGQASPEWRVVEQGTKKVFCTEATENLAHMVVKASKREEGYYRIIDGERRWRAAELAGLERIPVMIVDTSSPDWEKQKLAIQVALNQQHENLTALEEAAAYAKEIKEGRHTAESLYKAMGISRSALFGRLALNRVQPFVRDALITGKISTSVAGLFPMIPDVEKQKEFLTRVAQTEYGPAMSFREAQDELEAEFCQQLKGAPFKLDDAELLPEEWGAFIDDKMTVKWEGRPDGLSLTPGLRAHTGSRTEDDGMGHKKTVCSVWSGEYGSSGGKCIADKLSKPGAQALADFINRGNAGLLRRVKGGACTDCPFRTGNMAEYPDNAKRPNVCTQPACYHQKVKAHWIKAAEGKVAKGETVLDATTYKRSKGSYVEADKEQWMGNRYQSWEKAVGKKGPEPVLAVTDQGLIKVYPKEEAVAAARKNGAKFLAEEKPKTPEDQAKEKAKREERQRLREAREKMVQEAAEDLAPGLEKLKDKDAWAILERAGDQFYLGNVARKVWPKVKSSKAKAMVRLLSEEGLEPFGYGDQDWNKAAVGLWKKLGVDLLALDKELQKKLKAEEDAKSTKEKTAGGGGTVVKGKKK